MKKEERIREEVEKTLQAFDNMPTLEANPFLFTRIQAVLASQPAERSRRVLSVPGLKPVALAVIILLNIITAVHVFKAGGDDSREQLISTLSKDFNSSHNDF